MPVHGGQRPTPTEGGQRRKVMVMVTTSRSLALTTFALLSEKNSIRYVTNFRLGL